jgi:hypothetical protein
MDSAQNCNSGIYPVDFQMARTLSNIRHEVGFEMGRESNNGVVAASVAVMALLIAGCGGGSTASKPLTHAELVAKMSTICKRANVQLQQIERTKPQEPIEILTRDAAIERADLAEFDKIKPPADLAIDWKKFVEGTRATARHLVKFSEYIKTNNVAGAPTLTREIYAAEESTYAAAQHAGFIYCRRLV